MGLDNGIIARSDKRKLTRNMLPDEIEYPFYFDDREEDLEIVYWRKNWGLRNKMVKTLEPDKDKYYYNINTVSDVFNVIKIIVSYMNKEKWEEDGESIWEYDEIKHILQRDVLNLAMIAAFMKNNPDVYLVFYDSY